MCYDLEMYKLLLLFHLVIFFFGQPIIVPVVMIPLGKIEISRFFLTFFYYSHINSFLI